MQHRRSFLKNAAGGALAAPAFIRNLISAPPSSRLRLAAFGADRMAYATLDGIATHPNVTLVAAAEVDATRVDRVRKKYPQVKIYEDWRRMLDEQHQNVDIASVGTPDHTHAPMAMRSMQHGLHVYVQKPLAHDIHEVRRLAEFAQRKKLVTQMGIQRHSGPEYRTTVTVIQGGAIGKVKAVHSWSDKKWGDPEPMPDRAETPPATLNWDLWLGVVEPHPYVGGEYYHPINWRKRIDFGTATFGDMGCHIYDPVFSSLELGVPVSVRSEGPDPTQHNWALNSEIHSVFPGTRFTAGKTITITWYDGDARPPAEVRALIGTRQLPREGSIFIGEKGVILLPHCKMPILLPEERFKDFAMQPAENTDHYHQFVDAVLGKTKASAGFDFAAPLTEAVLLGATATRFRKTTLEWNAAKMKFRNSAQATSLLRRRYRKGWSVSGLG